AAAAQWGRTGSRGDPGREGRPRRSSATRRGKLFDLVPAAGDRATTRDHAGAVVRHRRWNLRRPDGAGPGRRTGCRCERLPNGASGGGPRARGTGSGRVCGGVSPGSSNPGGETEISTALSKAALDSAEPPAADRRVVGIHVS